MIKFVQKVLGVGFPEALEFLARRARIPLPEKPVRTGGSAQGPAKTDLFRANLWACKWFSSILWNSEAGTPGREYLHRRGLTEEVCRTFSLGFAPASGRALLEAAGRKGINPGLLAAAGLIHARDNMHYDMFRGRLIFPIFDATGNVVGFGGRTLGDDQPKYLNTPETPVFQKQRNVFGLFFAREAIQAAKQVVVVEGYTDCMAPFQAGIRNVVATLGTALTEQHVQTLRRYADQIVLVFDADLAGQKAADRALNVFLTMGVDVKVARVTSGKDPCDLVIAEGGQAFQAVIDAAVDALEYKWLQLQQVYNVSTSDREKRAAIDDLLTTVANCDPYGRVDVIRKGMLMTRLATLLGVPADQLHSRLQSYRRRSGGFAAKAESAAAPRPQPIPVAQTAAQAAFRDVLEVLVCEPGYLASVGEVLRPEEFEPEPYRKIAAYLWRCHDQLGEFAVAEVIGLVEEPELADIITQLYRQGTRKGNFAKTLEDAMRCIEEHQREQNAARNAASLSQLLTEEECDRQLQALYEQRLRLPLRRTPGPMID